MNTTTPPTTANAPTTANERLAVRAANEHGQLAGLEPNAEYVVIRRPALPPAAEARTRELLQDMRAFLEEHVALTQKQLSELNERLGDPRKKVEDARAKAEIRLGEVAKELEARYEKIEGELPRMLRRKDTTTANGAPTTTAEKTPAPAVTPTAAPEVKQAAKPKPTRKDA